MSLCARPPKKAKVVEIISKPNWLELPRDVTANILQRLDSFTILMRARKVCSLWFNICKDPFMWRTINMGKDYVYPLAQNHRNSDSLRMMCRYTVDLSCGQLEDISIYRFGTDDLLNYIADRANQLRRIEIDNCFEISHEGICEIAKKLPLVEELHIRDSFCQQYENVFEVLGRSCPLLKSLTYANSWPTFLDYDEEAFAIAKTMTGLHSLHISGNSLSHAGLTAILDGCPLLKSLDIRQCHNLDFNKSLWKRCQDQIKDLLYDFDMDNKFDPTDDENEDYDCVCNLF